MADEAPHKEPSRRNASPWVKAFVLFHIVAITAWALPKPSNDLLAGRAKPVGSDYILLFNENELKPSPVKYYVLATGFWQYWDMFAPNPMSVDSWCDADVTYQDGTTVTFHYPRIKSMSIPQKFLHERYRKYYERASSSSQLWPSLANRIARLSNVDPANPPVRVTLWNHSRAVADPGQVQLDDYDKTILAGFDIQPQALAEKASK